MVLDFTRDSVQLPQTEDNQTLCEEFAGYFSQKIQLIQGNIAELVDNEQLSAPPSEPETSPPLLGELAPTCEAELRKITGKSPNKSCELDSMPTSLLKRH